MKCWMMECINQGGQIKEAVLPPSQGTDTGPSSDNSPEENSHKAEIDLKANHMKIKGNLMTDSHIDGFIIQNILYAINMAKNGTLKDIAEETQIS